MYKPIYTIGLSLFLGVIVSVFSSCAEPIERDSEFTKSLEEWNQTDSEKVDVMELTSFEWDTFYIFSEGKLKEEIDEEIDATLFGSDSGRLFGHGTLVVFKDGDNIAHATKILPPTNVSFLPGHGYEADASVVKSSEGSRIVFSDSNTNLG